MKPLYSKQKNPANDKKPNDAATVILVRNSKPESFELFLMQRHQNQTFMGGAYVFPGGKLDEADCDPDLVSYARGLSVGEAKIMLNEPDLPSDKALGLFFTAIRETFEEAGVLLAAYSSEIDFRDNETENRFSEYRLRLHNQQISLKELAEKENFLFALDLLTPYSHWITPDIETKRYDTRFLLARIPKNQVPVHDSIEMTKSLWLTPREALIKYEAGDIILMPPTLKTIEELIKFSSIDQLFSAAKSRKILPIQPQPFSASDGIGLKLPHDPEYTISEYKQILDTDEPSRILMIDGKWKTL